MELLIVITVLILLMLMLLINIRGQMSKSYDMKRKTDMQKIQKAFEEYFNDTRCYPPAGILDQCDGTALSPYLPKIPCDPVTKKPYLYVPGSPLLCSGYRVCTALQNTTDPDIERVGCSPVSGCGFAVGYNYCTSMGFDAPASAGGWGGVSSNPNGGAVPTETPPPGFHACTRTGKCNEFDAHGLEVSGCAITYSDEFCTYRGVFQCTTVANRCKY